MIRTIRLPNGRSVSLPVYVRAWRALRERHAPGTSPLHSDTLVNGWDHFPTLSSDVLREIRYGLHDRINRHLPWYGKGRKWDGAWQGQIWRLQHDLQMRVAIHYVPMEFRARLAHRIHDGED